MIHTTRAVVLRTFNHGDRSLVLKAYTEAFGARSYLVRTTKGGGVKATHLQPLARLELVVTEDRERDMHWVREARIEKPFVGIAADPLRGMLLLFAQEAFYRTLRQESPDPAMFAFVQQCLEDIDTGPDLALLPQLLLVRLARHLGFLPGAPTGEETFFDLREGQFLQGLPAHVFCMEEASSMAFAALIRTGENGVPPPVSAAVRRTLLDHLLTYFRLHVEGFGQLRSPEVLHHLLH